MIPSRNKISPEHTWNASSLFDSAEEWEAAFEHISSALAGLRRFQGHLGDGPATLLEALEARDDLTRQVGKVVVYARLSHAVDTGGVAVWKIGGLMCIRTRASGQVPSPPGAPARIHSS